MKELYTTLRTRIETECIGTIKFVRLFNDQFNKSNDDNSDKDIEQAFPYPCVFIEFTGDNPQTSAGLGVKTLDVRIRFHIGFESYKLEDLAMFDTVAVVQEALEGYAVDGVSPLTYEGQVMDYDHNNVYVYMLDFSTKWVDQSQWTKRDATTIAEDTLSLSTVVDLDIDNTIIRTGDGTI